MTISIDVTLTREEMAYAHLASFIKDERVIIGGRGRSSEEAVILHPQRHTANLADAYLVAAVTRNGGHATISVNNLLSGRFHIEHDGDQTWFDEARAEGEQ